MARQHEQEMSIREFRRSLAAVVHAAAVWGQTTYLTNRGRRVAAVVPLTQVDDETGLDESATRHA